MIEFENDAERLHNLLSAGGTISSLSLIYSDGSIHKATVKLNIRTYFETSNGPKDREIRIIADKVFDFVSTDNASAEIEVEVTDVRDWQMEGARYSFNTGHGTELKFLCYSFRTEIIEL